MAIELTDAPVPTEADLRRQDALSEIERRWVARQAKKAARALGTSKYVRHQGSRERARRMAQRASA